MSPLSQMNHRERVEHAQTFLHQHVRVLFSPTRDREDHRVYIGTVLALPKVMFSQASIVLVLRMHDQDLAFPLGTLGSITTVLPHARFCLDRHPRYGNCEHSDNPHAQHHNELGRWTSPDGAQP